MTAVRVTYREKVTAHIFGTVSLVLQNIEQREKKYATHLHYDCDMFRLSKSFILSGIGIIFRYIFLIITALFHEENL